MLTARVRIRSWEHQWFRGDDGGWLERGQSCLVLRLEYVPGSDKLKLWAVNGDSVRIYCFRDEDLLKVWDLTRWVTPSGSL
jgi:hypothetical protein